MEDLDLREVIDFLNAARLTWSTAHKNLLDGINTINRALKRVELIQEQLIEAKLELEHEKFLRVDNIPGERYIPETPENEDFQQQKEDWLRKINASLEDKTTWWFTTNIF